MDGRIPLFAEKRAPADAMLLPAAIPYDLGTETAAPIRQMRGLCMPTKIPYNSALSVIPDRFRGVP